MAETDFLIKINTKADGKAAQQAEDNIEDVGDAAEKAGKQAKKAGFNFAEFGKNAGLGATAALTAVAGFIGFGAKIAGDLEAARQGFVALLGSAEKADATMSRIKEEAKATPFELPGLVKGTQALAAITKDGDKAIDMLLDVGKAIATAGKGQAELDSVILNLQQISSTGKISAMDIKQFQGAIPIFNEIVEGIGLTTDELKEADNAAELLQLAFEKAGQEGGMTAGGFTAQAGTFNQLISNMSDSFLILASNIVTQSGVFDILKDGVGKIVEALDAALPLALKFVDWIKNSEEGLPILVGTITGLLVPALWLILAPMLPVIIATLAFAVAGGALGLVLVKLAPVVQAVTGFLMEHKTLLVGLIAFVATFAIPTIWAMITGFFAWATTLFTVTIPAIAATLVAMGPMILIAGAVAIGAMLMKKAWDANFLGIRNITESVVNFVIGKINSLLNKINGAVEAYNKIRRFLGKDEISTFSFKPISFTDEGGDISSEPTQSIAPTQSFAPGADIFGGGGFSPAFSPAVGGQSTIQNFNTTNNLFGDTDVEAMINDLAYSVETT